MGRKGDPVTLLAANLMQVESWERKGRLDRARDMLEACKILRLPAVPEELRAPWERRIEDLDARLPRTSWSPADARKAVEDPVALASGVDRSPVALDDVGGGSEPDALRSAVWKRLGRALDDRSTDFVVLAAPLFRTRFDFVAADSAVQVWVTIQDASERAWSALAESRFIREAHAIAPGTSTFAPPGARTDATGWRLVWVFTSIPDARVEVKDEFLATAPALAPELSVVRHPRRDEADFDREVERLGSRSYRAGHGRKRFAVSTCAKCGQPLSDPQSVVLGIGPDCLKYFDPKVLAAARKWKPGSVRSLGRTPAEFFKAVTAPW